MSYRLTSHYGKGIFHVHTEDCQEAQREIRSGFFDDGVYDDLDEVTEDMYGDHIEEDVLYNGYTFEEAFARWRSKLDLMPCVE